MSYEQKNLQDVHAVVSAEFARRPTIREVASTQLLRVLSEHLSILATASLPSAEYVTLLIPQDNARSSRPYDSWASRPLLDCVMDVLQAGRSLASLGAARGLFQISLQPPYYLRDQQGNTLAYTSVDITSAMSDLENLVRALPEYLSQAQVDYWSQVGSMGVPRERWLAQVIRIALLQNLPVQGLDDLARTCVLGLLQGGRQQPSVFVVEVHLLVGARRVSLLLPELLLQGEHDAGQAIVWCAPSSVVQAYVSLDAFAQALCESLAERYRFDSMTWDRHQLEGDSFAQQCTLLLERMLGAVERLRYTRFESAAAMELVYSAVTDPAQWFVEGYRAQADSGLGLPPGLRATSALNSFACQTALFDLALAQAQSDGVGALDDILDLHSYAGQRLRAQMLVDHPVDANYVADDLQLTLVTARGMPGGPGAGVGGGTVETRNLSLTAFAIGNLASLSGATVTAVSHAKDQLIMDWLTPDYLQALVTRVDIGGNYPNYVAQQLDDPGQRQGRISRFAREWRCSLLFSALSARVGGTLSEAGMQAVGDYCRGLLDTQLPATVLMPLAFKREPGAVITDVVAGMYVLKCTEPSTVLLFRPLYGNAALLEFTSLAHLMEAIRAPGALQDSIVAWLPDSARPVYDNGGFLEPHLGRPVIDTSILPEPVQPASFSAQFWKADVDAYLYKANRALLIELADRSAVSNAESRWEILARGSWLLFDVATLLLRGPVATVAWLVQAFAGIKNDVSALLHGTAFERSAAVVDLVLNASMALMHARLPSADTQGEVVAGSAAEYLALAPAGAFKAAPDAPPAQGKVGLPCGLTEQVSTALDTRWRDLQGFNLLSPERRTALLLLRSPVSVNGREMIDHGPWQGLYQVAERLYVTLAGDAYEVQADGERMRVVTTTGQLGPWLERKYGQWRIDAGLRLRGGMPKTHRELLREANKRRIETLKTREAELTRRHNDMAEPLNRHRALLLEKDQRIKALEAIEQPDELNLKELDVPRRLRKQINIKLAYELKAIIDNYVEHGAVLSEMYAMRQDDTSLTSALLDLRSMIRQDLIDSAATFHDELASFVNTDNVDRLAEQITVHPESDAEIARYKVFREALEGVVKWETDLVEISSLLDRLLEETLKDGSIYFRDAKTHARINKNKELRSQIEARRLTAVDLEFRLLQDLAELSLDRLADVDERVLQNYFDYLASSNLRSAGGTHGDLAGSTLSLTDRIEVLKGVLEDYEEASTMAEYLGSVGGAAVRGEQLKAYQKVLGELKGAAEREMAQLVRESELHELRPPKVQVHAPRGGRRHLARTDRGRSVLAEEVEVDGVAVVQQRDYRTQHVLKTFRQKGKEWVEDTHDEEGSDPLSPLEPRIARKQAQVLVDQVDSVIGLARGYFKANEPLNLSTIIDGHLDKLNEALAGHSPEDELFEGLTGVIERLRAIRRDLLISLYFSTSRPNANSLRFLSEQKLVTVERVGPRKALATGDYLEVYEVRRLPREGSVTGEGLWEAHFHYPNATTPNNAFSKGHLKLWSQRKLGRLAQMRAATSGRDLLDIYRGELRLADLTGIIDFA
ncbi:dermonecrotic toxin domain-containing protein [Pseudomonas carassii]|uniref:DUF6543 domain-containing protein n=1 Tax=Pseudomonas carassii TaxID=3115855 RepID=A0ABU7H8M4_9PSED|nr:DUF6543 domain-containing protein [Pseudomonas sp. 137P]MEE1887660.1 DUF6543 domain-containing protein [Pseudomonas sp. 137P]